MPSISTIASPQPYIFTINDDSNEPTIPYGFGRQLPIVPSSLNDLNLPPNPFNIVATMAIEKILEMQMVTTIVRSHQSRQNQPQYRRLQ